MRSGVLLVIAGPRHDSPGAESFAAATTPVLSAGAASPQRPPAPRRRHPRFLHLPRTRLSMTSWRLVRGKALQLRMLAFLACSRMAADDLRNRILHPCSWLLAHERSRGIE